MSWAAIAFKLLERAAPIVEKAIDTAVRKRRRPRPDPTPPMPPIGKRDFTQGLLDGVSRQRSDDLGKQMTELARKRLNAESEDT
jgi:hypothetical protein